MFVGSEGNSCSTLPHRYVSGPQVLPRQQKQENDCLSKATNKARTPVHIPLAVPCEPPPWRDLRHTPDRYSATAGPTRTHTGWVEEEHRHTPRQLQVFIRHLHKPHLLPHSPPLTPSQACPPSHSPPLTPSQASSQPLRSRSCSPPPGVWHTGGAREASRWPR